MSHKPHGMIGSAELEIMAAQDMHEQLSNHESPLEAVQVYLTENLKFTIVCLGTLLRKYYLSPYHGFELANQVRTVFEPMPDRLWRHPTIVTEVSLLGTRNPDGELIRNTPVIGVSSYWKMPLPGDDESGFHIEGAQAHQVSKIVARVLNDRVYGVNFMMLISNRRLLTQVRQAGIFRS
jgi:hypothetical protein